MNSSSLYADLISKINGARRTEHSVAVQAGVLNALAAVIAVWVLAISLEVAGDFSSAVRTPLYWGAIVFSGLLAAWLAGRPLARALGLLPTQDDDTIARRVGYKIPEVGDRLVNTLQLYRTASNSALVVGYSPELMEASILAHGEPLRAYDYTVIVERDERKRAMLFFLSAVTIFSALFLSFPGAYGGALHRLTHYDQEFFPPVPYTLSIQPGDRRVILGDSLAITIRAEGIPPRTVMLYMQADGEDEYTDVELRGDSTGAFHYMLPNIRSTTRYYAAAGPVRTAVHTITVSERPEIRKMNVTVAYPGYTRRGTEQLPENSGDVSGLRGTSVNIRLETSVPVTKATIVQLFAKNVQVASVDAGAAPRLYDTARIPMAINGTTVTGGFRLTRDGEYYITLESADGLTNPSPIHYAMSVSSDGSPAIALITPSEKATIDETMLLPTEVHISDDYGFSRLLIKYRLTASKYGEPWKEFRATSVAIPKGSPSSLEVPYIWNMAGLNITPEDEFEFYFEVYDNDAVSGPKMARTGMVTVRFPSFEEVMKQAEQTQTQATADLDKVLKKAQEARREMDEMNRELMKQLAQNQRNANWQEQQKLQEVMKQHEQMEQKLQEIGEQLQEMTEKLKEAKSISPETMQKYMELQQLFQELKNPELMKSMEKLNEAMEKMTPEQMAEAMKNYKFNEEQFRKSIERTMKILERMKTEQKVDEMVKRADDLAKKQEELNKEMANTNPKDQKGRQELAERQKELAEQAERMKQEAKELEQKMDQQGQDMPNKEMQDANQQLEQEDPQEQMEDAGEQMEQGDMQEAQKKGDQAQQSAEKFGQKMKGVKQKMQENNQKAVTSKMKKALQDMLDLSKREEELKEKTEQAQPNSQQFRDLAQQQAQMEQDMQNIANQMGELSQKTFAVTPEMGREMGDAMRQMQGATQSLEQRDGFNASQQEGQAMGAMNRAAMMMQQALGQQQGQQQGQGMGMGMGSFQQRLQQLAAQQQMINMAMGQQGQQGQGQQGQGEGEGEGKEGKNGKKGGKGEKEGGGEEGIGKLQRQQQEVKKSVDDLNREMREQGGTRKNQVGDLERAAKEMEEVLRDMQSGQVTPETLERQQRILSRLLDAVKSNRERDFEKERESRPGVDVARQGPGELRLDADQNNPQTNRDLLNSREQGYTKDYEYMIRRYFESIGQGARQQ
jgi:hypothetical protein